MKHKAQLIDQTEQNKLRARIAEPEKQFGEKRAKNA